MHLKKDAKAVSTLIVIMLILCSVIFGAFVSYLWVMSNFYVEPSTTQLAITDINFPAEHADYFNVTIMNPSHSASGTNITQIYLTVSGNATLLAVANTEPEQLPIALDRASYVTMKCNYNWAEFAGKRVTVHVTADEAAGAEKTVQTPFVKLGLVTYFDPSISSKQFNITIENDLQSVINLTVNKVLVDREPITDMKVMNGTPITLPISLAVGEQVPNIQCTYDWENNENPVVRVETDQGYYAEKTVNATARVSWFVTQAMANESNPEEMNVTVFNSALSSTYIDIHVIKLTYVNGTEYFINGSLTSPQFTPSLESPYYRLKSNETVTFSHCLWNWRNYPDQNVTVNVYNTQSFETASRLMNIPLPVIFEISGLDFNITNTGYFTMNITNLPASTREISMSKIMFNDNATSFENQSIPIGQQRQFNCTFDWSSFKGQTILITVNTSDGFVTAESITLDSVDLRILRTLDTTAFNTTAEGTPYVNITVLNTIFSIKNVTITQITLATSNSTYTVNGTTSMQLSPNGYLLVIDSSATIVCPWNWNLHTGETLTVTVQTAEGFAASQTYQIP